MPVSETEIRELVDALGDVRAVLGRADMTTVQPSTRLLGLRLTYEPEPFTARAAIEISAHS